MDVYYSGDHSVTIGDKHSWNDWHLVPKSIPIIEPPPVHTNTVEIPGANGYVDLTDFPRGFPTYGNREGSIEFYVNHTAENWGWTEAYDTISNYLHGQRHKMILDEDHSFYYEGRFAVNSYKSSKLACSIIIDYDLFPYKKMVFTTAEPWPWNPFDFKHGILINESDFIVDSTSASTWTDLKEWNSDYLGLMPITPVFTVTNTTSSGVDFQYCNWNPDLSKSIDSHGNYHQVHLAPGVNNIATILFATPKPGDRTSFNFKGIGTISIDYRQGRL